MRFLQEALRAPHITGAIAPSSRQLAEVIVDTARVSAAERIVELGPGTGVFTRRILDVKPPGSRFLALERNPRFAADLKSQFPTANVVEGCASELRRHAANHEVAEADSIVSGLPWAIFDGAQQNGLLAEIRHILRGGGVFATFAYFGPHWLPSGQGLRKRLRSHFSQVTTSRVVLANLPPAFVYSCTK